jgi:hypothetical protein
MIVNNLDVIRVSFSPFEADTPLLIDTDAMLARAITRQLLQVVRRGNAQIRQSLGSVKNLELSSCGALYLRRDLSGELAPEQSFCLSVAEAPNPILDNNAKR